MSSGRARATALALLGAALGLFPLAGAAEAQYFGRNKVQYENFEFEVLKTDHFDIYYYPEEREAVEQAGRMAERWYARLSRVFNHELRNRQVIILYADHTDFEQTTALPGNIDEGTGGVTEAFKRRVVLPIAASLKETDHVLGHELVHAFQFDITSSSRSAVGGGFPVALSLPLWFIEGMAEYVSLGPDYSLTAMWMHDAARRGKLPSFSQLYSPVYNPYRYGQALWAYIGGRWGDPIIGEILKAAATTGDAGYAIASVLEISPDQLMADWQKAIDDAYEEVVAKTHGPLDYGRELISRSTGSGHYNVAPAISPDGSRVVFLTEKDYYHIEMFMADGETGKIERKLVKTASDPHYESLQFINSAGDFHPNGRDFVFAGVVKGTPSLTVIDTDNGKTLYEHKVHEVGEIYNPNFSPDGNNIVFSASVGGLVDLYSLDVNTDVLTRLTNDKFADLQPSWSPDGKRIVFVTDRFSSRMRDLRWGNYGLALLDVESGEVTEIPGFPKGKRIDPQWAPDGESIYFISDQNGISNIYRVRLSDGDVHQVTQLTTGVSGITDLSPAMSLSNDGKRLVFSVFEGDQYSLYAIESSETLAGGPVLRPISEVSPSVLPPADRAVGDVMALVNNADLGLPSTAYDFETAPYHAGLSLDYIAPPNVVVGSSSYGTFVGGGTALFWSDILGEHNLATMLQVNGSLKDIAALVSYGNQKSRWNWGLVASQFPYVTRYYGYTIDNGNYVETEFRYRQTSRELAAIVDYPISRVQRVEFSLSGQNVGFDWEVQTRTFAATGQQIGDETQNLPAPPDLWLATGSVALVYDNTLFGMTGPVLGQRYRFEVSPTAGSLNFAGVLFDYRRYFMPFRYFTLAGRVLEYGRYGTDGEDLRIQPIFIGYQQLVRGYDPNSFSGIECADPLESNGSFRGVSTCPVYDQLFGSRMLVGNLELRMPMPQALGLRAPPGLPGITMAFFFDVGAAWWTPGAAKLYSGNADPWSPVTSYGIASRINLFGVLLLEVDFVHPNSRPSKGWFWQFGFSPGF